MWRVIFCYFNPKFEFEDECIIDFISDLEAWRFHDIVFKSPSVLWVRKPFKIL